MARHVRAISNFNSLLGASEAVVDLPKVLESVTLGQRVKLEVAELEPYFSKARRAYTGASPAAVQPGYA